MQRYEEQYLALIDELHNLPGHPYLYLMAPPEAFLRRRERSYTD